MTALLVLAVGLARAQEHRVLHAGQSVRDLAAELGAPELEEAIRQLNGLAPGEEPPPGTILLLPPKPGSPEVAAVVITLRGQAVARRPAGEADLLPGMALSPGTTVCTGEDSYASLRLAPPEQGLDHDDLTLLDRTCVTLRGSGNAHGGRSSLVALETGSLAVQPSTAGPGTVTVQSADGVTSGAGGGFRVTREPESTRTEALAAPVSVLGAGVEVRLQAGQGSRVRAGQAPEPAHDLAGAPSLLRPDEGAPLVIPEFAWAPVPEALGYRVEIAGDPGFQDLLVTEEVEDAAWSPGLLLLPTTVPGLWWRATAFDRAPSAGSAARR